MNINGGGVVINVKNRRGDFSLKSSCTPPFFYMKNVGGGGLGTKETK